MSWLPWILFAAVFGVAGVAVLGVLSLRVLSTVRELGREIERGRQRLEPSLAAFEEATERRAETESPPGDGRARKEPGRAMFTTR